nr:hypothetical protein [Tanacetum cinerariifolium]
MLGFEYGEQDRKAAVLYEYETFKLTEGELLLDTYIRYLLVINDLKKCGYSKDNYVNDVMGSKKKTVVVTSDPLALIGEKINISRSKEKVVVSSNSEGSEADDFKKANLETIESLKSKGFELSESAVFESKNQNENDCHKIEKFCDKEENPKDLDTFSSVRRPKNSGVIWKKKRSSNTSNVGLSAVSVSNLNKNIKRYSRKDLLACNNYHLGETSSAYMCNDAMNVSCDSRMNDLLDDNNFFIFDDVNVRISHVSKIFFRKKPRDSMNVHYKSNSNKSLPRMVHKWLPKLQLLDEPVAKWESKSPFESLHALFEAKMV